MRGKAMIPVLIVLALRTVDIGHAANGFDVIKVGSSAFEPGIHVSPTGRIFVDGPGGLGGHGSVRYSDSIIANGCLTNCFKSITIPAPLDRLPGSGDTEVAIGHNNRVYYLDLWVGSDSFFRSDDGGTTFSTGSPVSHIPAADRQWMAVGPVNDNGEDTIYIFFRQMANNQQMMARSDDGGLTWLTTSIVGTGAWTISRPVADDTGYVGFAWIRNQDVNYSYSKDKGATWTTTFVGASGWEESFPTVARTGNRVIVSWIDRNTHDVMFNTSSDDGETWTDIVGLPLTTSGTSVYPWLAAQGDKVAVAYFHNAAGSGDPNLTSASATWQVYYAQSNDRGDTWSTPVAVSGNVKRGPICTKGLGCDTPPDGAGNRDLGDFLSTDIDPTGRTVIAYMSAVNPTGQHVARQVNP